MSQDPGSCEVPCPYGGLTLCLPLVWQAPWLGAALMVSAAFGMIMVDTGGNMLFLLAVRKGERPEMTAVYSTFRYAADIAPPGAFALLLTVFKLPAVFVTGGLVALGLAVLSRKIHWRLGREARPAAAYGSTPVVAPTAPP